MGEQLGFELLFQPGIWRVFGLGGVVRDHVSNDGKLGLPGI